MAKRITKADKEARKSDDLMKRNFKSAKPLDKCVTDMTGVKFLDGKLYVKKHRKILTNHILELEDVSCILTGAHSTPVSSTVTQ